MLLKIYPAIFHKEDESYWVEFPDLPGCQSVGDTLEEITLSASEALGLYLYSLKENGIVPNHASDIENIEHDRGSFVSLVSCNLEQYEKRTKSVKKTLTIPEWLNEEAEKKHLNFSSVLQQALLEQLN